MKTRLQYCPEVQLQLDRLDSMIVVCLQNYLNIASNLSNEATANTFTYLKYQYAAHLRKEIEELNIQKEEILKRSNPSLIVTVESVEESNELHKLLRNY